MDSVKFIILIIGWVSFVYQRLKNNETEALLYNRSVELDEMRDEISSMHADNTRFKSEIKRHEMIYDMFICNSKFVSEINSIIKESENAKTN